jgi:PAS domain S-box-containing protein
MPAGDAESVPLRADRAACENCAFARSESHIAGEDSQFCRAQNSWVDHDIRPLSLRESAEPCDKQPLMRLGPPSTIEGYLAAIVDSSDDAIISTSLDGVLTSWNRAAVRLFGYTEEEAVGSRVQIIVPPDRADEEKELAARVRNGETVEAVETVRQAKDGSRVDVSVVVSPIRDKSGAVAGIATIARDIREQVRADFATRRLAAIIMSSDDAIVSKDLNGIVTSWNPAAERLFGYTADEMIGRSIKTIIPAERMSEEDEVLSRVREGVGVDHFETVRRRKDGSTVEISLTVSPIRNARGTIVGASKICRDVTERNRLREMRRREAEREEVERLRDLEAENRRVTEANRLKSAFVANMSHELRTPLNSIIGFTELLYHGRVQHDAPQHQEFLGDILRSARHLLRLINDVLDLAKVESGRLTFRPEPIDLAVLVAEVRDVMRVVAAQRRTDVQIDVDPSVSRVELDPARLKQVLYNYLSNAIKFTPMAGRVIVRVRPEGRTKFRIEVEDNGIGVPAEDLPRLFVEFQQLDTSTTKRFQGTGLGLALTRRIVEAQGGTVGVTSTPDVGSTFYAVLPRALPALTAPVAAAHTTHEATQ